MVKVDTIVIGCPALGQERAMLEHPVKLYDRRKQAEGVEANGCKGNRDFFASMIGTS
jgi:hypothetical protein